MNHALAPTNARKLYVVVTVRANTKYRVNVTLPQENSCEPEHDCDGCRQAWKPDRRARAITQRRKLFRPDQTRQNSKKGPETEPPQKFRTLAGKENAGPTQLTPPT